MVVNVRNEPNWSEGGLKEVFNNEDEAKTLWENRLGLFLFLCVWHFFTYTLNIHIKEGVLCF